MLNPGLYNMDCMDGMKRFPDGFFDLAIVDPPYGIGAGKPSVKPCSVRQRNGKMLQVLSQSHERKNWDDSPPDPAYFQELFRVSRHQIIWGINYFGINPGPGRIVWDKLNGESDQMGCEIAYCSLTTRMDIVRYMWSGMFQGVYCGFDLQRALVQQGNKALNETRVQPAQKPVILYKWQLSTYAKPGFKILDTHVGSASSMIACHQLGFECWGFEADMDHYAKGNGRLLQARSQVSIFDKEA